MVGSERIKPPYLREITCNQGREQEIPTRGSVWPLLASNIIGKPAKTFMACARAAGESVGDGSRRVLATKYG